MLVCDADKGLLRVEEDRVTIIFLPRRWMAACTIRFAGRRRHRDVGRHGLLQRRQHQVRRLRRTSGSSATSSPAPRAASSSTTRAPARRPSCSTQPPLRQRRRPVPGRGLPHRSSASQRAEVNMHG